MSLYCGGVNFGSASLAPALQLLIPVYHGQESFSSLSHLVAVNVLMIGVSNIFWVPLANTFGRRPVLIVAMLMSVLASMWCGLAGSFGSLLAARAVQGVGFGPADSVAANVVGEVFFVHERGRAMVCILLPLLQGELLMCCDRRSTQSSSPEALSSAVSAADTSRAFRATSTSSGSRRRFWGSPC